MFKKSLSLLSIAVVLFTTTLQAQEKTISVANFDKVIVSPHISVTFKKGIETSVAVTSITEPMNKLNVEVKNNKLSLFLDDARILTKNEKKKTKDYTIKKPIYKGTVANLVVTYTTINDIELRGEEKFYFADKITTDRLRVRVFGESQVTMNSVALNTLQATLYGESHFEIENGVVDKQKITAYGEATLNTQNVESKETKLTAYGDGSFQLNVADKLKVTSYGEATIVYKGNAELNKGIVIGETSIIKKTSGK